MKSLTDIFNKVRGGWRQVVDAYRRSALGKELMQQTLEGKILYLREGADDTREERAYNFMGATVRAYQRNYLSFQNMADFMTRAIILLPQEEQPSATFSLVTIVDAEQKSGRITCETAALSLFEPLRSLAEDVRCLPREEFLLTVKWIPLCLEYGEKARLRPDHLKEMQQIHAHLPQDKPSRGLSYN